MNDLRSIETEITVGIEKMQRDLGITQKKSKLFLAAEFALIFWIAAGLLLIFTPRVKAQMPTKDQVFNPTTAPIICTNQDEALGYLKAQKNINRPMVFGDQYALHLTGNIAQLAPSSQAILLSTTDGRIVILACGPGNTWVPRHYMIDVEAERRFYNHAPEIPQQEQELPKKRRKQ